MCTRNDEQDVYMAKWSVEHHRRFANNKPHIWYASVVRIGHI